MKKPAEKGGNRKEDSNKGAISKEVTGKEIKEAIGKRAISNEAINKEITDKGATNREAIKINKGITGKETREAIGKGATSKGITGGIIKTGSKTDRSNQDKVTDHLKIKTNRNKLDITKRREKYPAFFYIYRLSVINKKPAKTVLVAV